MTDKKIRIRKACDSCNAKRTKCDGNMPCAHCIHIRIDCTYLRQEKRRGRASEKYPKQIKRRKTKELASQGSEIISAMAAGARNEKEQVQIDSKRPSTTSTLTMKPISAFQLGNTRHPILLAAAKDLEKVGIPFEVADELLLYYFDSEIPPASKVFSILRRTSVLSSRRKTKPSLLLAVLLSSACQIDHRFFAGSNRDYASQALYKTIQELLPTDVLNFDFDDYLTVVHLGFLMPWVSYPSDSEHWWKIGFEVANNLNITSIDPSMSGDMIEERLRGWWGLYILDRLTSLCFNLDNLMSDEVCQTVYLPYDEIIWNTTDQEILHPNLDINRSKFVDSSQVAYDLYGWSIPICSIMGKFSRYRRESDVDRKLLLKNELIKSEHANYAALDKFQIMIHAIGSPHKEEQATLDILYAKYINLSMTFISQDIEESETLGEFKDEVTESQSQKLAQIIQVLEEILKLDESLHKYPFLLSFFLFVVGGSFLSVLNNIKSGDHTDVTKINRIKYFVKVLVRAIESILIAFPAEFLRTVRNQLTLSIKDCENLILLTDYIDKFKENSRKRKEALKAYIWSNKGGRGIAI